MTFKIVKATTGLAALNLKISKSVSSPASSLSADQVTKTDLITGGKFSAAGIQEKVIAGAGIQDIARADQIIGILDRGGQSSFDQFGLRAPSVQNPVNPGGGVLDALDPESFISAHDKTGGLTGASRGARMEGGSGSAGDSTGSSGSDDYNFDNAGDAYIFELDEDGNVIGWDADASGDKVPGSGVNLGGGGSKNSGTSGEDGNGNSEEKPGLLESIDGCTTKAEDAMKAVVIGVAGTVGNNIADLPGAAAGSFIGWAAAETMCALDDVKEWVFKNPNPEDDGAYGDYDISGKPDPLGVFNKLGQPIERLAGLNPTIDPLDESYGHHGAYTGPSLGAVTGSNGGTSTGSWNNPYGFGGYSGPSIDAIGFSHGGNSTGTFDPLF